MKTDKKALLAYAERNGWKYPKIGVIVQFAIGGGAIGGFIVGIGALLFNLLNEIFVDKSEFLGILSIFSLIAYSFVILFFSSIVGVLIGFIPALLTGIYLSLDKFIIFVKRDYLMLFIIGFSFSLLVYVLFILLNKQESIFENINIITGIALSLIGGITSSISGKLFLPKLPKNF